MRSLSGPMRAAVRDFALGKGEIRALSRLYGVSVEGLRRALTLPQGKAMLKEIDQAVIDSYVRHLLALEYAPSSPKTKGKPGK